MRRMLIGALTCLASFGWIRADDRVPQDPALSAKRAEGRLEWTRRTLVGAYDKVGEKDLRWDAKARETLETATKVFGLQVDPVLRLKDIRVPAAAAVAAGCDDPMVVYLHRRTEAFERTRPEDRMEVARGLEAAAEALGASGYPALRRAAARRVAGDALSRIAWDEKDDGLMEEAREQYEAMLAALKGSTGADERDPFAEDRWFDELCLVIGGLRRCGMEPVAAYERVDAAMAGSPELERLRMLVRGNFWLDYGWEARTKSFAPGVTADGFAKLEERSAKALQALERRWELGPDAVAAKLLMEIDKSVGGDRKTMETWFGRAMKVDPDNRGACWSKLDWLDPKWHGTWEELIAFGRACRATGNWRTGITLLAADAHHRYASRMTPIQMIDYLGDPAVWGDIAPAYHEYLQHFPDDVEARTKFAYLCYRAGHYAEAHTHFQKVGDALATWREFPYPPLHQLKGARDQSAQVVAGKITLPTAKKPAAKP